MTQKLSQQAYQNKKEYNNQYNSKKIECICGSIHRYDKKYAHVKTQKHQNYMSDVALATES